MDDKSMRDIENSMRDTLATAKYAPKPPEPPSIQDLLENIETEHKKLGDNIALLKDRVGVGDDLLETASATILNIIKTMRR